MQYHLLSKAMVYNTILPGFNSYRQLSFTYYVYIFICLHKNLLGSPENHLSGAILRGRHSGHPKIPLSLIYSYRLQHYNMLKFTYVYIIILIFLNQISKPASVYLVNHVPGGDTQDVPETPLSYNYALQHYTAGSQFCQTSFTNVFIYFSPQKYVLEQPENHLPGQDLNDRHLKHFIYSYILLNTTLLQGQNSHR